MPGEDRKGPLGEGPRTGRGLGRCNSNDSNDSEGSKKVDPGAAPGQTRGLGRGMGRGLGRGQGRGRGLGRGGGRGGR